MLQTFREFFQAFGRYDIWMFLARQDIKLHMRRSVLGPGWITLSSLFFIVFIGLVFSKLWKIPLPEFMPYFSISVIVWNWFADTVNQSCQIFIRSAGYIQNINQNKLIWCFHSVWRDFLRFLYVIPIYFGVALYYDVPLSAEALLAIPAVALVLLNFIWMAVALGMLCVRFRDIQPIIGTGLSLLFLVTPIIWEDTKLDVPRMWVEINPLYHILEIIREPLLGGVLAPHSWAVVAGMAVLGWLCMFGVFHVLKHRIAVWI